MSDRKQHIIQSPDLSKMQEVVIDLRTKIYIPKDADPNEARKRYLERFGNRLLA